MLNRLYANHASFKTITFSKGVNIIVAEKTTSSSNKDSRNTLGKTTFIEIIDFCLGSDLTKNSKLNAPELQDWSFTLDLEISNYHFEATRFINDNKKIYIHLFCKNFPIDLKKKEDATYVELADWRTFLGEYLFNIQSVENKKSYIPSARSILGYFIRKPGGYTSPFETFKKEKAIQRKINNAFVLNLLWEKSLELFDLQTQIDKNQQLIKAYKYAGYTPGKVNAQIVILSQEINILQNNIKNFNVLPEYKEIQDITNKLTKEIHKLNNIIILNQRKLDNYKTTIQTETSATDFEIVETMYKEVNILFPENITKTLECVKSFNEIITKNRKEFLQTEIQKIEAEINNANKILEEYSSERAEKMKLLSAHGALDEYSLLQKELTKKIAVYEKLNLEKEKQEKAKQEIFFYKSNTDKIKYEISNDLGINEALKEEISIFNQNSMKLYNMYANLIVDIDDTGNYKYSILREKTSEGVERMDIFCYDLMLIEMYKKNLSSGIDFLIHDSTIYDAVDSRQRASAIELAKEKSLASNFQYIFTINSDLLETTDFSKDFNYNNHIVCKLNDGNISGSLLGIKYSSPIDKEVSKNIEIETF